MKKFLLLISILSLFAYGCNRDEGIQQEEYSPDQTETFEDTDVQAVEPVEPSMQEDSDMQRMDETEPVLEGDPARESDPSLESDPGMQEEQTRFEDSQTMDPETAPVSEPMDDSEVQQ